MKSLFAIVLCIYSLFAEVEGEPSREDQLKFLNSEYAAVMEVHRGLQKVNSNASDATDTPFERDRSTLYLPKYLELAEAFPQDQAAFEACSWIITQASEQRLQQKVWLEADTKCWRYLTQYHYFHPELKSLILSAGQQPSPTREELLESLPQDWTQTVEVHGHAFLALAEMKVHKYNLLIKESAKSKLDAEAAKEWRTYMANCHPERLKSEIHELYSNVLAHYSHIQISNSGQAETEFATLGERAQSGLEKFEQLLIKSALDPIAVSKTKEMSPTSNSKGS